jgi:hypothetical protein
MLNPIINVADVSLDPNPPEFAPTGPAAERFEAKTGVISARIGARKLGYNITAVPPGSKRGRFTITRPRRRSFSCCRVAAKYESGRQDIPFARATLSRAAGKCYMDVATDEVREAN